MKAPEIRRAEQLVDRWHIDGRPAVEVLTELLEASTAPAGRKRSLPVRTLLVGRVLLADTIHTRSDAPQMVNRLHRLFTDLHPKVRARLGISSWADDGTETTVTLRQVRYLWKQLVAVLDPSPHFGGAGCTDAQRDERARLLQAAVDGLLDATMPDDLDHGGSYAIDSSYLPSWAAPHWRSSARARAEAAGDRDEPHEADADPSPGDTEEEEEDGPDGEVELIGDPELKAKASEVAIARLPADRLTPAQRAALTHDPDARHRWMQRRRRGGGWAPPKKDVFGYQLTIAVRAREDDGHAVPPLVERLAVRPANDDEVEAGRELVEAIAKIGGPLSDVLVDRGFSYRRPERFALPLRRLGADLVIDLHKGQRGVSGTSTGGALWIDGWPHSPATPEELWDLEQPRPGDSRTEIVAKLSAFEARYAYALRRTADDETSQRFECPASAGSVICPLKPKSMKLDPATRTTIWDPPDETATLPTICEQRTVRIPFVPDEQAWIRQRHYFGSFAWYESFKRRNVVEGVFGHLKNEAAGHLQRGNIRAFGIAENTLLIGFVVAAGNLRMLDTFRADLGTADEPPASPFVIGEFDRLPVNRSARKTRPTVSIHKLRQRGAALRAAGATAPASTTTV